LNDTHTCCHRINPDVAGLPAEDETMKRYMIERDIPGVARLNHMQLKTIAAKSNDVLGGLSGKVQWVQSFVAADKTFCVYLAESEALVLEHARLGGFPVTKLTEVPTVISPMTAYD
jgi:Nickel responsive protein SCO4226-like